MEEQLEVKNEVKQDNNKKLKKNIILNTLYQILTIITPLITAPYISRVIRTEGVGIYSYTNSLVSYFTMVAALGTASYGVRTIALHRDDKKEYSKTFFEIELISVVSTLLMLVFWLILAHVYKDYSTYLYILSFTLLATLFDISWLYAGLEKYGYSVSINAIFKVLSVILILTLVKTKDDLWKYILIMSLSTFLGNLSMWVFLPRLVKFTKLELYSIWSHLKNTLIYFIPTIATTIYTVLDKSLIGILIQGEIEVEENGEMVIKKLADLENGYYEQANKIISLVKTVAFFSINGVMCSRASYLYGRNDKDNLKNIQKLTLSITTFLSIGALFGVMAIAKTFVPVFFGEGYDKTIYLLYILSPIILIICISNVLGNVYYTPYDKKKSSATFLIIGSIVNLILNIPFIILFKSIGAAIASVIAELVITTLYFHFSKRDVFSFKELFLIIYKKIIAGLIMFLVVFFTEKLLLNGMNAYLSLAIQIGLGGIVYLLLLFILKDNSMKELIDFVKSKK